MRFAGDDLCGLSYSARFNSHLISIWHRNAADEKSKQGLLSAMLDKISPDLKPEERAIYYKAHNDHATFSSLVAQKKADGGN